MLRLGKINIKSTMQSEDKKLQLTLRKYEGAKYVSVTNLNERKQLGRT